MDKICGFQITGLTLRGFKSFVEETHFTFGDPTAITGGNGKGKSSLADAIAFAITGLPFFGERKIDRLHNEEVADMMVALELLDDRGLPHQLVRTRKNSRMTISYDGYELRQMDLSDMFGERDVFLSIFNPLYFIEVLGEDGKHLLERYLPMIPRETVLNALSEPMQQALQEHTLVSPEGELKKLREDLRELENLRIYLQGQQDLIASQEAQGTTQREMLLIERKTLEETLSALSQKQFAGLDREGMEQELVEVSGKLSELQMESSRETMQQELLSLTQKLADRKAEQYVPKYSKAIGEMTAAIELLAQRYHQETEQCKHLVPGVVCPACRREVTEADLPAIKQAFRDTIEAIVTEGREKRSQLKELHELEHKAETTFQQFKAEDLQTLTAALQEMQQAGEPQDIKAQKEALRLRMQTLTSDLEYGNLTGEEYEQKLQCSERLHAVAAELSAMDAVQLPSADAIKEQMEENRKQIEEAKRKISCVVAFISKRAELTLSCLSLNRVAISLMDVVKSTGEVKDVFRFTYQGRRYDTLSLSEKIRAGLEVSELLKRLTGRSYPVFVDNMESVDAIDNIRPTSQVLMAKCMSHAPLQVRPIRPIVSRDTQAA